MCTISIVHTYFYLYFASLTFSAVVMFDKFLESVCLKPKPIAVFDSE